MPAARTLCTLMMMLCISNARAHLVELIYLEFETNQQSRWTATIYFDAGYALPEMRADKDAPQPKRAWLLSLTPEQWAKLRRGAADYIAEFIEFRQKNHHSNLEPATWEKIFPDFKTDPPDFPVMLDDGAYFRIVLAGELQGGSLTLRVRAGDYPDITLARNGTYQVVPTGMEITLIDTDPTTGSTEPTRPGLLKPNSSFLWLGFLHVLPDGLDHVLFILALFIYTPHWKPLLHQSIIFTLAHSITLGLMLSGLVHADGTIIEPLIALSIAWVAFEHLFFAHKHAGWQRLSAVFAFGLIHGFGFASSLSQGFANTDTLAAPLIAANIGIELAQITILAFCLILFHRYTDRTWFSKLRNTSALLIGLTGIWWCLSRVAGI